MRNDNLLNPTNPILLHPNVEHRKYSRPEWREAVAKVETILGYWDWQRFMQMQALAQK